MAGRPRLYAESKRLTLLVEQGVYQALEGGMLPAWRARTANPEATVQDLVRDLIGQAVKDWRRREAQRSGAAARREREIKRVAAQLARAGGEKQLDERLRRLTALAAPTPER